MGIITDTSHLKRTCPSCGTTFIRAVDAEILGRWWACPECDYQGQRPAAQPCSAADAAGAERAADAQQCYRRFGVDVNRLNRNLEGRDHA